MSPEGARLMERLTTENLGRRMAIVLDYKVESAPYIQGKISTNGQITLGSGRNYQEKFEEANDIALVLKAGALPAPVTIFEERTVGATLGPELVTQGHHRRARRPGRGLLFMLLYYRISGLIADVALVVNGLLVLAIMSLLGSTLTLPGIAGFVLTLGMAVDANVLINERIREELRAGKTVRQAVRAGLRQGLLDHRRQPRHRAGRGRGAHAVRLRPGPRIRRHPDHRPRSRRCSPPSWSPA